MLLYSAIVPPPEVLDGLEEVVAKAQRELAPAAASGGRGLFGRRRRATAVSPGLDDQLSMTPASHRHLLIAKFGNLSLGDVDRLADALRVGAQDCAAPRLQLAGGEALEGGPMDQSVWAKVVDEDDDQLAEVVRLVPRTAQRLQLFVDRRRFRPLVEIGTINNATTEAYLETLLEELNWYVGPWWTQSTVSLLCPRRPNDGGPPYDVVEHLPLGG